LYASPNIIRQIKSRRKRWPMHKAHTGDMRNKYRILVGKPKGKRPLGTPRCKCEDNIRMDLGKTGWKYEWMCLAQDRGQ
jgi:hypothetical protein